MAGQLRRYGSEFNLLATERIHAGGTEVTGILVLTARSRCYCCSIQSLRGMSAKYVAVVLMSAAGGLLICRGAGFARHLYRTGVTERSGLYIPDCIREEFREKRGICNEVLLVRRHVSGVLALWIQLFLRAERQYESQSDPISHFGVGSGAPLLFAMSRGSW